MDRHLEGVVVCICGRPQIEEDKNQHIREQFTDENVSRWLKYRGGQLVEEVTKATTHLICSRAAWAKKGNPKIKAARKYRCEVVTYEWLTDTFQLWDYHSKKKAPTSLYHPGKPRDGDAISNLFKKSEKKPKTGKKKASSAAADATDVDHDDDAQAADEVAGMKHLTISEENPRKVSEEKESQKVSEAEEGKGTRVIHGMKGASTSVGKESGKPTGKLKKKAKIEDQKPPVDLSLYEICKDESGLRHIELWKPDSHGNERGSVWYLELYESKSEPKTYLFGARRYPTSDLSTCIRRFPSKAPGGKKHELKTYKSVFRQLTGVNWLDRYSIPSKGPYYFQPPAALATKIGDSSPGNKLHEFLGGKQRNQRSSVAVPQEQRDGNRQTSSKRKSSFTEERPAKVFKVTKPLVIGGPAKNTDGGSKTART